MESKNEQYRKRWVLEVAAERAEPEKSGALTGKRRL
jgi:hypothetical protein